MMMYSSWKWMYKKKKLEDSFLKILLTERVKRKEKSDDFNESISLSNCTSSSWSPVLWFISIWVVWSMHQVSCKYSKHLFVCLTYLSLETIIGFLFLYSYFLVFVESQFFLRYDHWNKSMLSQFSWYVLEIQSAQWIDCLCAWHCFSHHRILTV